MDVFISEILFIVGILSRRYFS